MKRFNHGVAKLASQKNEDRFCIRTQLMGDSEIDFYGVFDGHAGSDVSDYCSSKFYSHLVDVMEEYEIKKRFPSAFKPHGHDSERSKWSKEKTISVVLESWGGTSFSDLNALGENAAEKKGEKKDQSSLPLKEKGEEEGDSKKNSEEGEPKKKKNKKGKEIEKDDKGKEEDKPSEISKELPKEERKLQKEESKCQLVKMNPYVINNATRVCLKMLSNFTYPNFF
jgi:hypothetical protein